jgi:hypothetical protein
MRKAGFTKPGQCSACRHTFTADTMVIRTVSGPVLCERHEELVVADAIVARGVVGADPEAQVVGIRQGVLYNLLYVRRVVRRMETA